MCDYDLLALQMRKVKQGRIYAAFAFSEITATGRGLKKEKKACQDNGTESISSILKCSKGKKM